MEASDVFGGGVEISDEVDPFDGTDFGDFGGEAKPAGELPVVDKEGNRIEPQNEEGTPDAQPSPLQPQDGASAESQAGEAAQPTGEVETPPPAAPAPAEHAREAQADAPAEAAGPTEPEPAPEPAQEPAGATAEQVEGDQGDPTPASSGQPTGEPTSDSSSSESDSGEPEDAPPPEEPTDKSGRRTQRRYVILRVDGPGKFTQVDWFVDEAGKMSATRKPGHRRQTVALARGAEDALKIGYAACGAPQDGVTLVAVAQLHFQPKKIRPMPPEPTKQRLQIS